MMANNQIRDNYPRGSHNHGKRSVTHSLFRLYPQSQNKTKGKIPRKRREYPWKKRHYAACMEKRERGAHQDESFKDVSTLLCLWGSLSSLTPQSSRSFHHWGIPVLALNKFNSGIPCFLPLQTTLWSQE